MKLFFIKLIKLLKRICLSQNCTSVLVPQALHLKRITSSAYTQPVQVMLSEYQGPTRYPNQRVETCMPYTTELSAQWHDVKGLFRPYENNYAVKKL